MRKAGVGLVVLACALLLYMSLAAPAYARAHQDLGPAMLAAYAGSFGVYGRRLWHRARADPPSPWRTMGGVGATRDDDHPLRYAPGHRPRCRVVLDPHQHGCHTVMLALLLGIVGLALAGR
jgi:hypothetical protein